MMLDDAVVPGTKMTTIRARQDLRMSVKVHIHTRDSRGRVTPVKATRQGDLVYSNCKSRNSSYSLISRNGQV